MADFVTHRDLDCIVKNVHYVPNRYLLARNGPTAGYQTVVGVHRCEACRPDTVRDPGRHQCEGSRQLVSSNTPGHRRRS